MVTSHLVALSKQLGPRHYELLGATPNSLLTPATRVSDEWLLSGRAGKFLADLSTVVRDGVEYHEAIEIRPLRPNPIDIDRLVDVRRRFIAAGAGDPTGDPEGYLAALFSDPDFLRASEWNPETHLIGRFLATQTCFPLTWWHDDPEPGINDMIELVAAMRLPGELPTAALLAEANRDLDESGDEVGARDRLCVALVDPMNERLKAAGESRRLQCILDPVWGDGDPSWVLLTPELYLSLLRESLFTRWPGRVPPPPATPYSRPPDRGEIDLSRFPSGDDPF